MKKYLFILAFLAFPTLSHAQVGGVLTTSQPVSSPPISRTTSYQPTTATNPGTFQPTEVMPWDDAIDLANRLNRNNASLGLVAREAREQRARETSKPRVLSNDDLHGPTASNGRTSEAAKQ